MSDHHEHQEHKKKGHFFDGFMWGAAIGGGLAYLLSTKKGRDLVKDLVQDGIDALDDLSGVKSEIVEEELQSAQEEVVDVKEKATEDPIETQEKGTKEESSPASKKRFFKAKK